MKCWRAAHFNSPLVEIFVLSTAFYHSISQSSCLHSRHSVNMCITCKLRILFDHMLTASFTSFLWDCEDCSHRQHRNSLLFFFSVTFCFLLSVHLLHWSLCVNYIGFPLSLVALPAHFLFPYYPPISEIELKPGSIAGWLNWARKVERIGSKIPCCEQEWIRQEDA